jgi:hypothetical protein
MAVLAGIELWFIWDEPMFAVLQRESTRMPYQLRPLLLGVAARSTAWLVEVGSCAVEVGSCARARPAQTGIARNANLFMLYTSRVNSLVTHEAMQAVLRFLSVLFSNWRHFQ